MDESELDLILRCNSSECQNSLRDQVKLGGILSDRTTEIFAIVNSCILSLLVCTLGSVANVIIMIVYLKMGFNETINISLFGLAISDLLGLLTLQMRNIGVNPLLKDSDVPVDWRSVGVFLGAYSHDVFSRATCLITAYITIERCLSVTIPLKVKYFVTSKVTVIVVVTIFLVSIGTMLIPFYIENQIVWTFYPERNRTVLSVRMQQGAFITQMTLSLHNVFGSVSLLVVVICTVILIRKLKTTSKWRKQATESAESSKDSATERDRKVITMITFIAILLIICFLPVTMTAIGNIVEPEFNLDGRYRNLNLVVYSFIFVLEAVNSSGNLFIYLKMSSKFRKTFYKIFGREEDQH